MSNVPKLRFKGFSGEWKVEKFKQYVQSHKGGASLKPSDFVLSSDYEVIPKKAIQNGGKLLLDKNNPTFCTEKFFMNNVNNVVDNTYLITTLRDLVPSGPSIGYIVKNQNDKNLMLAQGVYGFIITDGLSSDFLIHYSNRIEYRRLMQRIMVGSTQVHIRNQDFFGINICLPPKQEQEKIASFLTSVDTKIQQLTKKEELLSLYKKGVMQKIFSGEIRFKADDGSEFAPWEEKKIGELFKFKQGVQCGVENQYFEQSDEQIRFIRIVDVTQNDEPIRFIDDPGSEHHISKDDLFMVRYGAAGVVGYGYEGVIANNLFRFLPIFPSLICNKYYYFLFNFMKQKFEQLAGSSTMPALNFKSLNTLNISQPCLEEQTKIANFLSSIDSKCEQVQKQLDSTKEFKKALLQQMFV